MPTSGSYLSLTSVLPPPPDLGLPSSNKLFLLGHLCHSLGLQSKGHTGSGWLPHGSDSFDSLLASSLTPLSTRSSTGQATIVQRQDGGSGPVPHPHMPSLLLERSSQNTRALESHSALRTKSGLPAIHHKFVPLIPCPYQAPISRVQCQLTHQNLRLCYPIWSLFLYALHPPPFSWTHPHL